MSLELGGGNRDRFKYDFNYCIYYTEYCNYSDYLNARESPPLFLPDSFPFSRIVCSKRGKFSKSEEKKITGTFQAHLKGFGFVSVEGEKLMDDAIRYAGEHRMMISLETHNEKNVAFYAHFGFKVFGIVEKGR